MFRTCGCLSVYACVCVLATLSPSLCVFVFDFFFETSAALPMALTATPTSIAQNVKEKGRDNSERRKVAILVVVYPMYLILAWRGH